MMLISNSRGKGRDVKRNAPLWVRLCAGNCDIHDLFQYSLLCNVEDRINSTLAVEETFREVL